MARWHAKLKNWHAFGTLARWYVYWHVGTLACTNEKLARLWHIGTLARGHVDHAGMHGTHASNLANSNTACAENTEKRPAS